MRQPKQHTYEIHDFWNIQVPSEEIHDFWNIQVPSEDHVFLLANDKDVKVSIWIIEHNHI